MFKAAIEWGVTIIEYATSTREPRQSFKFMYHGFGAGCSVAEQLTFDKQIHNRLLRVQWTKPAHVLPAKCYPGVTVLVYGLSL